MQIRPGLKRLAVLASIGMIFLILGGALVTKTDSGDGCGTSFPLCKGKLIPDEVTTETIIEASHRLTTLIVLLIVIFFSYRAWKELGHLRDTRRLIILGIFFFIVQSLVGAARVMWGHADFILALHFGISLISFGAVFMLTLWIFELDRKWNTEKLILSRTYQIHTIAIICFSFIVIYSGAYVQHTNASMICPDWPFCRNDAIGLPHNYYEWVQMAHRLLAGLLFVWILSMFVYVSRHYKRNRVIYYSWFINVILISLQVLSGALVIKSGLNLYISLLHAFFITCLFGSLSYLVFMIYRYRKEKKKVSIPTLPATAKENW